MMGNVRGVPSKMRLASVSRTVSLTKPDYSAAAKRFVRWRKKNWKRPRKKAKRPKFVRYWQSRKPV
jgi:hypothetical protein